MTGTEIISILSGGIGEAFTAVGAVAGSLITAIFLRHNTSIKEFEKIKAGKFKEVTEELLENGKMSYTEFYKANNFLKVAQKADAYYKEMPHLDKSETYDFDWFIRFYEAVGNISNDEMQDIWAKILAGEINKPKSFSLKTIDVLKNIGKDEAEFFATVCKSCFSFQENIFLPFYDEYMQHKNITYSMVMFMNELGLMYNDGTIVFKQPISKEREIVLINGDIILTVQSDNEKIKELEVKQFPLTQVGREISSLIGGMPTFDDLTIFVRAIKVSKDVHLELHKIIGIEGNAISFDEQNLLIQD